MGASFLIAPTKTVLRIAYSHSYETPLVANVFGAAASLPLKPGIRNMYNAGQEQKLVHISCLKATISGSSPATRFDLDTLFTTAIFFPIEWDHSKMDGVSGRLSLRQYKGLTAYTTLGHTRARVFGPENGGLIFASPVDRTVVRIDHDQAIQSTTHTQYQVGKNGLWVGLTWRYDSGIVSGAVPDL